MRAPSETTTVTSPLLKALSMIPGVFAFRNNIDERGRVACGLGTGSPDIVAIVRGRWVCLECKTPSGELSPDQQQWHARARRCGALVVTVRTVQEGLDVVVRELSGTVRP